MDIKQINYILAIAEEGGVTKAAKKLYITQSALDQQLIKLEKDLGVQLFVRSRNSFVPTTAGKVYVEYAKRIVSIKNEAYLKIQDIAEQKKSTLTMALAPERGMDMFLAIYPRFYHSYPQVTITPRDISVKKQIEMLQKDELDLAFLSVKDDNIPSIVSEHLSKEEFFLITPKNHPLAEKVAPYGQPHTILQAEDLKDLSYCLMYRESTQREVIDPIFKEYDIEPNIILETTSNRANISIVEKGLACSIVPKFYVKQNHNVACFRLSTRPTWNISVCYRNNRYQSKAAQYFIELAKEYFESIK
ncbi:MAG: LysR family transcriptional regulator [Clostridia bacterium]